MEPTPQESDGQMAGKNYLGHNNHPQLFEWGVSIQGARLTGEGRRALEAQPGIPS